SRTARMTCSRVSGRTLALPLITRDTVIGETSAAAATSWIVTARPLRRADLLVVAKSVPSPWTAAPPRSVASPLRPDWAQARAMARETRVFKSDIDSTIRVRKTSRAPRGPAHAGAPAAVLGGRAAGHGRGRLRPVAALPPAAGARAQAVPGPGRTGRGAGPDRYPARHAGRARPWPGRAAGSRAGAGRTGAAQRCDRGRHSGLRAATFRAAGRPGRPRRGGLPDPQHPPRRARGHGGGRQQRHRRALRHLPPAAPAPGGRAAGRPGPARGAKGEGPRAQPLGQPGPLRRARLRRRVDL